MSTTTLLARTGSAEWTRIWSVRSTWLFAAATALVVTGFATLLGHDVGGDQAPAPPEEGAWAGGRFAGIFALFGILAMSVVTSTADHAIGGIVPTLQWTPRRGVLLVARTGVTVATMTIFGWLLATVASVVVLAFVPGFGLTWSDGLATLGDLGFVYAAGSLLAMGLGLATRSTAGALVSVIALVLVLPLLMAQFPHEWSVTIAAHLPGSGVLFLIFGDGPLDDMTTMSARVTLAVWAVAAMLAGGLRLLRSDADR